MNKLILVGAGGFAKEVIFLIERNSNFHLIGIVDSNAANLAPELLGYPILGDLSFFENITEKTAVGISIADPDKKKYIYERLLPNNYLYFPNLLDTTALLGKNIKLGEGNIIMAHSTFTADISIGSFNMINIGCTIGHDSLLGSYNSIFPSVNISGNVSIGSGVQFGVGSKIIPNITIEDSAFVGAGAVVIRDVKNNQKVVGIPAKPIESRER